MCIQYEKFKIIYKVNL